MVKWVSYEKILSGIGAVVARTVRDREAVSSNLTSPTKIQYLKISSGEKISFSSFFAALNESETWTIFL